jgi:alpha-mannosidase
MQQQRAGSKLTDLQPNASAVPNTEPWGLLWDFTTLRELISTLPDNSTFQNKALTFANDHEYVLQKGSREHPGSSQAR